MSTYYKVLPQKTPSKKRCHSEKKTKQISKEPAGWLVRLHQRLSDGSALKAFSTFSRMSYNIRKYIITQSWAFFFSLQVIMALNTHLVGSSVLSWSHVCTRTCENIWKYLTPKPQHSHMCQQGLCFKSVCQIWHIFFLYIYNSVCVKPISTWKQGALEVQSKTVQFFKTNRISEEYNCIGQASLNAFSGRVVRRHHH